MDGMEMTATSSQATSALVVAVTSRFTPGYLRASRSDV